MTNEEAIQQLKFIKRVDNHVDTKEAIDIILNIIQENTKLKAEIERLKIEQKSFQLDYELLSKDFVMACEDIERLKKELHLLKGEK